jgi:hypothetical protein
MCVSRLLISYSSSRGSLGLGRSHRRPIFDERYLNCNHLERLCACNDKRMAHHTMQYNNN